MAHMRAGGASLHDGRTWHGSGPNDSAAAPRRGLGIHFVPACATFAPGAELGKLWAPLKQPGTDALPDDLLPVTWVPSQQVQVLTPCKAVLVLTALSLVSASKKYA